LVLRLKNLLVGKNAVKANLIAFWKDWLEGRPTKAVSASAKKTS
jgi:hypothetical protein